MLFPGFGMNDDVIEQREAFAQRARRGRGIPKLRLHGGLQQRAACLRIKAAPQGEHPRIPEVHHVARIVAQQILRQAQQEAAMTYLFTYAPPILRLVPPVADDRVVSACDAAIIVAEPDPAKAQMLQPFFKALEDAGELDPLLAY